MEKVLTRKVTLSSFLMDGTAVTNKQFAAFIKETNYVTDAERFGWSYVFHSFVSMETGKKVTQVATQTLVVGGGGSGLVSS